MDREAYEQLVSEWLNEPERGDLRARIEAAAAESPTLAHVKDEWLCLDRLVRGACPGPGRVDWHRFRRRIAERLGPGPTDRGLDEGLRKLTAVEQRVDWPRLRQRISAAAAGGDRGPMVGRFPRWRVGVAVALAAAAVLVFMFALPTKPAPAPAGFARVRVSAPAGVLGRNGGGRPFARVTVSAALDRGAGLNAVEPAEPGARQSQRADVFLMIEPVRVAAATRERLIPFGFD